MDSVLSKIWPYLGISILDNVCAVHRGRAVHQVMFSTLGDITAYTVGVSSTLGDITEYTGGVQYSGGYDEQNGWIQ